MTFLIIIFLLIYAYPIYIYYVKILPKIVVAFEKDFKEAKEDKYKIIFEYVLGLVLFLFFLLIPFFNYRVIEEVKKEFP